MCRLFGYKTENPQKTNNLFVKSIGDFRYLAKDGCVPCGIEKGHNDGWGIVLYKDDAPCFYYRSVVSIKKDNNFDEIVNIIKKIKPNIAIIHLRKISVGAKTIENTQPFLSDTFSLAHNGTISYSKRNLKKSDTFLFFKDIINSKNLTPLISFKKKYKNIILKNNYTSTNMIFSDGLNLFATKNINYKHPRANKFCFDKYYTLNQFDFSECLFICSEETLFLKKGKKKSLEDIKIYKY